MPKVDFYILAENNFASSMQFICRLLDKAYQQNQPVYVHIDNEMNAKLLDDTLWTFRDDAFIPHCLANQPNKTGTPIIIGFNQAPNDSNNILINLTAEIPSFYTNFKRVIEIVFNETQAKDICRKKFRQYKEFNCDLNTHDLTATGSKN